MGELLLDADVRVEVWIADGLFFLVVVVVDPPPKAAIKSKSSFGGFVVVVVDSKPMASKGFVKLAIKCLSMFS